MNKNFGRRLYAARRECRLILPNEAGEYGAEYARFLRLQNSAVPIFFHSRRKVNERNTIF
jgi:hypothetical protein